MLCETPAMTSLCGERPMLLCAHQTPWPGPLRLTLLRHLTHMGICCSGFSCPPTNVTYFRLTEWFTAETMTSHWWLSCHYTLTEGMRRQLEMECPCKTSGWAAGMLDASPA